jgi:hypothetical protein
MITKKSPRKVRLSSQNAQLRAPLSHDWLEHDFAKDPSPLIDALKSDQPLPKHLRYVLIDLLTRYQLKGKLGAKRTPFYLALSYANAKVEVAAEEFFELKHVLDTYSGYRIGGPIKREEMDAAIEQMKIRAKADRRGHREFDGKKVAQQLRKERKDKLITRIASDFDLRPKTLRTRLNGRRGSSRRPR